MIPKNSKLRAVLDRWHLEAEQNKPIVLSKVNEVDVKPESNDEVRYLSVECDNDNGMTIYDYLYNNY